MTAPDLPATFRTAATRFPLICRPHLYYSRFADRVNEVRTCASKATQDLPLTERINSACAVWNLSALIASDCGMPDLAADLCSRQLRLFRPAWPVTRDVAIAALQPVVNLIRLTARAGDRDAAYQQLIGLHGAVHHGGTVTIYGEALDFTGFTTAETIRHITPWMRTLMVEDGTRLLASTGQWARAARHATTFDDAPDRLNDSRQTTIIARLHAADPDHAARLIDTATITHPWEHAVAALLRHHAAAVTRWPTDGYLTAALHAAERVLDDSPPHTRMFRVRLVLAALDLAADARQVHGKHLYRAIVAETSATPSAPRPPGRTNTSTSPPSSTRPALAREQSQPQPSPHSKKR
jgi:hypothetical protein